MKYEIRIYYGIRSQKYGLSIPSEYEHKATIIFYAFERFMNLDPLKLISEIELRDENRVIIRSFRNAG